MESMEELFVSPSRGFMEGLYQVMASWFRDIEPIFEIDVSMLIYPVLFIGTWKPRFSSFFIHGGKGFADNTVQGGRSRDLGGKGSVKGSQVVNLDFFL